ncbi:unnamed protein product [Mucor hiemalis]
MYNSASKKKFKIGLAKFAWIMLFLPNLKIIKSNNINFKVERNDSITDEEGRIECVDISLGNTVTSPTTLLNSIITNYHKSLKSIKLVTGERKDKWLPFDGDADELVDISPFKANGIDLEHLESVDLSFFGYMVNTDRFLDELVKTNCRLKDLTLLGCVYGRSVLYTITNYYSDCLESLKLSTEYYCDPSELKKMERLRHFSYIWENLEEKVDILKILKMIPNLTSLELGYSRLNSDIVNNDINLNSYANLTQLSLHRLNLEGGELYNLQKQLPHLDELFLTSCKFGKSRIEKKATLDLRNYTLGKLVLESCSLHFSKKEAKNKRLITRFKFNILQEEPYVVNLESTVNDEGRIVAEGGSFVYELGKRNEFTLLVKITSMEKFSCSKSLDEYVGFLPESEIEVNDEFVSKDDDDSSVDNGERNAQEIHDDDLTSNKDIIESEEEVDENDDNVSKNKSMVDTDEEEDNNDEYPSGNEEMVSSDEENDQNDDNVSKDENIVDTEEEEDKNDEYVSDDEGAVGSEDEKDQSASRNNSTVDTDEENDDYFSDNEEVVGADEEEEKDGNYFSSNEDIVGVDNEGDENQDVNDSASDTDEEEVVIIRQRTIVKTKQLNDESESDDNEETVEDIESESGDNEEAVEDEQLPQIDMADADDFGYELDDNIVYSSDMNQSSMEEESIHSGEEEEVIPETNQTSLIKVKKPTFSDLDYESNEESDEDSDRTTTDEEFDDKIVRRSTRLNQALSDNFVNRKRKTRSYYANEARKSDEGDDGDFVRKFISKVRKYRAVIRLKSTASSGYTFERSPSL